MIEDMTYPNFMWKEGGAGTDVMCYFNEKYIYKAQYKKQVSKEKIKEDIEKCYKEYAER